MASTDANTYAKPPVLFESWWKKEKRRRARHEFRELASNVFTVGLAVVAVALGMASLEGISEIGISQTLLLGVAVMILGICLMFLDRWATDRD